MKSLVKSQDQIFLQSEGNQWFERNQPKLNLKDIISADVPLKLLSLCPEIQPNAALEVGCSNGWRLEEIRKRYSAQCSGIDPSIKAVEAGGNSYPQLSLHQGVAASLPYADRSFDLIIIYFVFHWISRETLLKSISEIDRVLKWDGHLIIGDFSPDTPTAVKYHHLPEENVWTYKQDYSEPFLATEFYQSVSKLSYPHNNPSATSTMSRPEDRAKCELLKKSKTGNYTVGGNHL